LPTRNLIDLMDETLKKEDRRVRIAIVGIGGDNSRGIMSIAAMGRSYLLHEANI